MRETPSSGDDFGTMLLFALLAGVALVAVLLISSSIRSASKAVDKATAALTPERVAAAAKRVDGWTAKLQALGNRKL